MNKNRASDNVRPAPRDRSLGWRNMLPISQGPSCSFSRWSVRISLRMPSIFDSCTLVSIR